MGAKLPRGRDFVTKSRRNSRIGRVIYSLHSRDDLVLVGDFRKTASLPGKRGKVSFPTLFELSVYLESSFVGVA